MNPSIKIIIAIIAVLIISPIIFFYDSVFSQYIILYCLIGLVFVFPFAWFFYCYRMIKKYISEQKPWLRFTKLSTTVLASLFIALLIVWGSDVQGMEGIAVFWAAVIFIVFTLINILIQFWIGNSISKKFRKEI